MKFLSYIAIGSIWGLIIGFLMGLLINGLMNKDAMSVAWFGGGFNADEMNRYKLIQALSCLITFNLGGIIGAYAYVGRVFHISKQEDN